MCGDEEALAVRKDTVGTTFDIKTQNTTHLRFFIYMKQKTQANIIAFSLKRHRSFPAPEVFAVL